eukprot:1691611-Rhodomonas_salina.3
MLQHRILGSKGHCIALAYACYTTPTLGQYRTLHSTRKLLRQVSTGHGVASYARSVPDMA